MVFQAFLLVREGVWGLPDGSPGSLEGSGELCSPVWGGLGGLVGSPEGSGEQLGASTRGLGGVQQASWGLGGEPGGLGGLVVRESGGSDSSGSGSQVDQTASGISRPRAAQVAPSRQTVYTASH